MSNDKKKKHKKKKNIAGKIFAIFLLVLAVSSALTSVIYYLL